MALELNTHATRIPAEKQAGTQSPLLRQLLGTGVSNADVMLFTEQLSLMLETGNDLHTSIETLASQSENPRMQAILSRICDEIRQGRTFSYALAKHPDVFSSTYVSLIAASEGGGYMDRVLKHLLEMEQQREELRSTLVSAFTYPAFLIVFSISVVVFVLVVVFPKFGEMFSSIHDQLPVTTLFLMWMSNLILAWWWALLIVAASLLLSAFLWLKSPSGTRFLDWLKLKLPLIKDIFMQVYLIQSMRVLGLSLDNGVPMLEALDSAKTAARNLLFRDFMQGIRDNVNEGRNFHLGFTRAAFIPPLVKQMITTGEETGNLPLVLARISSYYQKELDKKLKILAKLVEPAMLLIMGVVVGLLVSSLILPIFKLSRAIH